MRSSRTWLDDDHRQLDHVLADVEFLAHRRSFALAGKKFKVFQSALHEHLKEEEETLFPRWRLQTGAEATLRLLEQQHAQLEVALEAIDHALKQSDYAEFCYGIESVSLLLHRHQTTEEEFLLHLNDAVASATPP